MGLEKAHFYERFRWLILMIVIKVTTTLHPVCVTIFAISDEFWGKPSVAKIYINELTKCVATAANNIKSYFLLTVNIDIANTFAGLVPFSSCWCNKNFHIAFHGIIESVTFNKYVKPRNEQ